MTTTPPPPWHCPTCDRELRNPRQLAVGCVDTHTMPMGDCPMHRTVIPDEVINPGRRAAS